jgi:hypothetical protein
MMEGKTARLSPLALRHKKGNRGLMFRGHSFGKFALTPWEIESGQEKTTILENFR